MSAAGDSRINQGMLEPGKLLSLWDIMIEFDVRLLITRLNHLERFEDELLGHLAPEDRPLEPQMKARGMPMWTSDDPAAFTTDAGRKWIWAYLGPMTDELAPLSLSASQLEIQHIWNHADRWTRKRLAEGFATLRWKIEHELRYRCFLYLTPEESSFFRIADPFGQNVVSAFRSAEFDIIAASKCFATGNHTACVFHLMRVAEIGLRVLAWDRRLKFKKAATPLELRDWDEILKGLEDAEHEIQKFPKTSAREAQFEFYHGAMVELRAFKNLYRHRVSHARESYDIDQARSATNHVSAFMNILAQRISEKKRTPQRWLRSSKKN